MKIDLNSMSFNSTLSEGVGTPSWGTSLGQTQGYKISVEGAGDLLVGMINNKIDESKLEGNFRNNKEILLASCFSQVYLNKIKLNASFILIITKENTQHHNGRKSLKYNDKLNFTINNQNISNELFFKEAQRYFGESACWFAYELNVPNGTDLYIEAIKVADEPVNYLNSKERKEVWTSLIKPNNKEILISNTSNLDISYHVSIKTKPFIILAGLSGTGKSRLARALAYQFNNINSDIENKKNPPSNFQLIKVKPNWHDSSDLLGYESRISGKDRLITTDFIRFIVKAWQHIDTPFFLCLDEMNLAPVEQYFAEYLSAIETRKHINGKIRTDALLSSTLINKYSNKENGVDPSYDLWNELDLHDIEIQNFFKENGIELPPNLIVIGTVNMDETTHSFSRKVLDRAMTIEMNDINLSHGLDNSNDDWSYPNTPLNPKIVLSEKTEGAEVFSELGPNGTIVLDYLNNINSKLEGSPFKIAYRVRDEFLIYVYNYSLIENKPEDWIYQALDEMTLMKILPRIEGDDEKTQLLDNLVDVLTEMNLQKSLSKATEMNNRRKLYHYTSFWL